MIIKKPVWSTYVYLIDGSGSVIHNYADGTNSGPLSVGGPGIHPFFDETYRRKIRFNSDDPIAKFLEDLK